MIDQKALEEVFPNNPVRQVVSEIRFPINLRIMRDICEVQEDLGPEYSSFSREEIQSENAVLTIYNFTNSKKNQTIRVWEDRFAVVFGVYESFEKFKTEAIKRTDKFCSVFRLDRLTRIGLRYINNIVIPEVDDGSLFDKYLCPYFNFARVESSAIKQFGVDALMQKEGCLLNVRSGFVPKPPAEQSGIYVLDLDAFNIGVIVREELENYLDRLHYNIQVEFLNHITEEYKEIMRRPK